MREILSMLSLVALVCAGCASFASHDPNGFNSDVNSGVYRGVREDWRVIAHSHGEETLGKPISCLDMPFSFVVDTLILPFDICESVKKQPPPNNALQPTATSSSVSTNK